MILFHLASSGKSNTEQIDKDTEGVDRPRALRADR
jgi:hypothetical protein